MNKTRKKPENSMNIDTLFIEYANIPMIGKPETLLDLNKILESYIYKQKCKYYEEIAYIKYLLIEKIISLYNGGYQNAYLEFILADKAPYDSTTLIAYHSIYGYLNNYCNDQCSIRKYYKINVLNSIGKHFFNHKFAIRKNCESQEWIKQFEYHIFTDNTKLRGSRIKCFECMQMLFRSILDLIIQGRPLTQILPFSTLLYRYNESLSTHLYIDSVGRGSMLNERLERSSCWEIPTNLYSEYFDIDFVEEQDTTSKRETRFRWSFNLLVESIVSYSLITFLLTSHDSRARIKKCNYCHKYSIAKRISPAGTNTFCANTECKDLFHRRRRMRYRFHKDYMITYRGNFGKDSAFPKEMEVFNAAK